MSRPSFETGSSNGRAGSGPEWVSVSNRLFGNPADSFESRGFASPPCEGFAFVRRALSQVLRS